MGPVTAQRKNGATLGKRALIGGLAGLLIAAGLGMLLVSSAQGNVPTGQPAPTFTLTDIYGNSWSLTSYRNSSVVVIEFTALSCVECQVVKSQLLQLYAGYNATGHSQVQIISIYIEPQFGDTIPALRTYHDTYNITWTMAQDTQSLAVSSSYGVAGIPDVFVIDKQGRPVYDQTGSQDTAALSSTVSAALHGTAAPIGIVTVSVFALATIAGVTTFFSPCSFPMFPGYMGLFLGLNTKGSAAAGGAAGGPTYKGAARRAAVAGSATAAGMLVVFLVIGLALVLAANAVSKYIPDLLVVVGAAVIVLGALLLTNLSYWRIITPFQNLWRRIRGTSTEPAAAVHPAAGPGERFYLKLFGYGVGYAAAAAGCVAPVIFSAVFAGLALGLTGGILTILIYATTAAVLMIVVTVLLAVASKRFINQLKAATEIIKKVSAGVLIVVGAYLVYFYYIAWHH